ncbi:hypothetical protein OKW21_003517 [Catalinimonas alkaloidigena]|uniref:hypothetical protein n=1 Tax=Catalinimonas alkaloidigena TaxID=1075417 RepID=UPI0024051A4F|nr:hypothetical protein [Catalinimonas alkaloidigena]MDF9798254.1 hypothetical protein [Catalinimonas alkaloidigena]
MKTTKMSALTICTFCLMMMTVATESKGQSTAEAQQAIQTANDNYVKWFNQGQVDSLMTLYREDACVIGIGCNKNYLTDYYRAQMGRYSFNKLAADHISIQDTIAKEEGKFSILFASGNEVKGTYVTEWQYTDGQWQIKRDQANITAGR